MHVRSPSRTPSPPRGCASPSEVLIAAAVLAIVAAAIPAQSQFIDVTATRLPADNDRTEAVALGDVDGDGDLDVVFGTFGPAPSRLYLNDGTGKYSDASAALLPPDDDPTLAVAMGDVDGDGDSDLVFGNFLDQNRLYLNNGQGSFVDVTAERMPSESDATRAAVLADVDDDGDLDLVLGNGLFFGQQNRLYLNDGRGRFTDVTSSRMPIDNDKTLAVAQGDVDGDGDVDLIFGNFEYAYYGLSGQNRLYLNDGHGYFTDVTADRMPTDDDETQAVALGDVDGDGDLDVVLGSFNRDPNRLYMNDGTGNYTDATAVRIPADNDATGAVALGDVDGDGDLDMLFGNTTTTPQNRLYLNLLRHLDAPLPARLGLPYQLAIYARYGAATSGDLAYPLLAPASANVALPPLGTLFLAPSAVVALRPVAIPQPAGVHSVSLVVPAVPSLVGATIYAQALLIQHPAAHLTNLTADVIQP